jgi:hypothetical protein
VWFQTDTVFDCKLSSRNQFEPNGVPDFHRAGPSALPQEFEKAVLHTGLQPGEPRAVNDQKTVSTVLSATFVSLNVIRKPKFTRSPRSRQSR